jgi:hypothetical protein
MSFTISTKEKEGSLHLVSEVNLLGGSLDEMGLPNEDQDTAS